MSENGPGLNPTQQHADQKLRDLAIALLPHLSKNSDEARRVLAILDDLITFRETGQLPRREPEGEGSQGHSGQDSPGEWSAQ
jgi:hypothetical protein